MTWDADAVLAASNEWAWVPDGAPRVWTEEYLVAALPTYFITPTQARVFASDRDPAELVDEVHAQAADWGRQHIWWTLSDTTRPTGLETELLRRGARVTERADVLALPLDGGVPDLAVPDDVEVRRVVDEPTLLDAFTVSNDAFGGEEPTREQIDAGLASLEQREGAQPSGRVVAYVDGRPAGVGGYTLAGPVCRLWGGGTHSELRGRGAYRAVLAERLRITAALGATLGLTHGVVETSSPILRRAGFTRYGEERELALDIAPPAHADRASAGRSA